MNDECMAKLAEQWGKICQHYSVNDHVKAQNFIQQHSSVLVNEFYSNIVLEPEAADFFKDDIIQQRLKNSSVHDKFHRTLILSGFCLLKIAKISLNSSFFPKPIKR